MAQLHHKDVLQREETGNEHRGNTSMSTTSFEAELTDLLPPAGFTFDAEAKPLFGIVSFDGPSVYATDADNVPGASFRWTPEQGIRIHFDIIDGHAYTVSEVKEFNIALMMALMRLEGIDPTGDAPATDA